MTANAAKTPPLSEELEFYENRKGDLLKAHPRQFLLIKGSDLVGAFSLENDAYTEGVKRFGREPFLVKQALEVEPIGHYFALQFGLLNVRP